MDSSEPVAMPDATVRSLVDAVPLLAWTAAADGRLDYGNTLWRAFTLTPIDGSAAWTAALHPDDGDRVLAAWRRAVDTSAELSTEGRVSDARTGEYRWFLMRAAPVRDERGTVTRWIGTWTDVEDARQTGAHRALRTANAALVHTEGALREEALVVETLQRIGGVVAAQLDVDAIVQAVTDEATRITGAQFGAFFYNVVNAHGESYMLYTIAGVPREAFSKFPMPRNTHVFAPTFTGSGVVRSDDITGDPRYGHLEPHFGMPAGHMPVVSYLAVPVISRSGEVLGGLFFGHARPGVFAERHERLAVGIATWAAVGIDNARLYDSERRSRTEAEQARMDAEEARRLAEEASHAKSQFLTTMSHELRTPLNAIAGYADLLLLGVRGALTDAQRADVERVRRSGQHLLSLINDVLNFAKLGAGQIPYQIEPVAIAPVLADIQSLVAPQMAARKLVYATAVDGPALAVRADAEKVRQILLNLVTNAIKFTNAGGLIHVCAEPAGSVVRIRVRDTGRGIAPAQQSRVFDPFVQVDRQLTPESQQGVGLGLAISRDLARGMDGDLAVESTLGAGSTFTLTLPRV